jgi:hypothetical protein
MSLRIPGEKNKLWTLLRVTGAPEWQPTGLLCNADMTYRCNKELEPNQIRCLYLMILVVVRKEALLSHL